MKNILSIYLIIFILLLSISDSRADEGENNIRVWTGVDVITNDYDVVEHVKRLTGIRLGDIISLDDPRLPAACNSIRAYYSQWTVNCTAVQMEKSTALYIVQISKYATEEEKSAPCTNQAIPIDVLDLQKMLSADSDIKSKKSNSLSGSEFINYDEVLDSTDYNNHRLSEKYYLKAARMTSKIERMFESCNNVDRKDSITMMNYVGDSKRAISLALRGIHDSDIAVRNVSLRLISSFNKFIKVSQNTDILSTACKSIERENFFDRNKGLMVILSILRKNDSLASSISPQCFSSISKISTSSESDQIGTPAKLILKFFPKK